MAQAPTATPAPITLPSAAPVVTEARETATWTPSPTPEGIVLVEAQAEVNVRANPDPEASELGVIRAGETYLATGRYFEWIRIEFPSSPDGQGWVYGQIVNVTGDLSTVADLTVQSEPTLDETLVNGTNTVEAAALVPGGLLTATADSRQIVVPGASDGAENSAITMTALPTFTYPPNVAVSAPSPAPVETDAAPQGGVSIDPNSPVAPVVPILIFGGLGILGLAVTAMMRR